MKRKKLILILLITIMFCVCLDKVEAVCYSYKFGGETLYTTKLDSTSGSNPTRVDDSYCTSNNTSDNNEVYNNFENSVVSCGNGKLTKIPSIIPTTVSIAYTLIQIVIPIVLVIFGMLDLFKGLTAQKEDEMTKGRQLFVKRLIYAALIFFVFAIVKIVISLSSETNQTYILDCAECFIKNKCD